MKTTVETGLERKELNRKSEQKDLSGDPGRVHQRHPALQGPGPSYRTSGHALRGLPELKA